MCAASASSTSDPDSAPPTISPAAMLSVIARTAASLPRCRPVAVRAWSCACPPPAVIAAGSPLSGVLPFAAPPLVALGRFPTCRVFPQCAPCGTRRQQLVSRVDHDRAFLAQPDWPAEAHPDPAHDARDMRPAVE